MIKLRTKGSRNPVHSPWTISKVLIKVMERPSTAHGVVPQSRRTDVWDGLHAIKGKRQVVRAGQ